MLIAQISDPHVLAPGKLFHAPEKAAPLGAGPDWSRIDTAACLAQAVVELNALAPRPDVAVVTGDLVDHGSAAEYEHLRAILAALVMPVFVIPDNHDSREGMREAFAREGYLPRAGFLHYAIEEYSLRIVALDTHIPGEHGGLLCAERLAWFDFGVGRRARAADRPPDAPPALRHPHRAYGPLRAAGHRRLFRDCVPQSANRAHLVRHLHRAIDRRFCRHGRRDRAEHGPSGLARSRAGGTAAIRFEPPGYQLQLWREGAGLVSHTAVSGDRPGSYPFRAAG